MQVVIVLGAVMLGMIGMSLAHGQTEQLGADARARSTNRIQVEYVGYRAATYETEKVYEPRNERPNEGGLIAVYLRNVSDDAVGLRFFRANGHDESHWLLGGDMAWHRTFDRELAPGDMTVVEMSAISADFGPHTPFAFAYVDRSWRPACFYEGVLEEDAVQISSVRIHPDMQTLDVHFRHTGAGHAALDSIEVVGFETQSVDWYGAEMNGRAHAIARFTLERPLESAQLAIVKAGVREGENLRHIYSHRRAFVDHSPIGTWSGNPDTYGVLRRHHIDMVVRGWPDDDFFERDWEKYGMRAMVHVTKFDVVDRIRALRDHPAVLAWMPHDEPDWSTPPIVMKYSDDLIRSHDNNKPTIITLCRNVKFFEYAAIPDIPCQNHYTVTAPSSSRWPHRYGTHLEETGYYTRDLKAASEPNPMWIWTQAIDSWTQRPARPVPTPEEMASQLLFNIGYGAKALIWYTYNHRIAEEYPDAREAIQHWGRVLRVIREDLLASDPIALDITAPEHAYVMPLVTPDKLIVCVNNTDYDIHPEAYPFRALENVVIEMERPSWISPAKAVVVSPDGIMPLDMTVEDDMITVTLDRIHVGKVIALLNDEAAAEAYQAEYDQARADESMEF